MYHEEGPIWVKIKNIAQRICDGLELVIAVIVLFGVLLAILMYFPEIMAILKEGAVPENFLGFLEGIFSIVVGIEFLKMLCKPNSDNVIEVLVFVIARHMIIGSNSALDNLLSIVGVAILFLIRSYFHDKKRARIEKENEAEEAEARQKM